MLVHAKVETRIKCLVANHSTSDIQTLFAKHKADLTADGMEAKAFIAIYNEIRYTLCM